MANTPSVFDENERLIELRKYDILDTLTEEEYENITLLASTICNVPIALISFVDQDRQWFKSHRGLSASETPRAQSFCAHAILNPREVMVIPDSRQDSRFSDNPLVTGKPNIVFYAGAPLVTPTGFGLGTICVIGHEPKELSADQQAGLRILADSVIKLLEARHEIKWLKQKKSEAELKIVALDSFAMVVAHDIKSPLSSIQLSAELLELHYEKVLDDDGIKLLRTSRNSAQKISSLVSGILSHTRAEKKPMESFDLAALLSSLESILTSPRPFHISYTRSPFFIISDPIALEQIFLNLLSNSLKYNDKPLVEIAVTVVEEENRYIFTVSDNGIGISAEDQKHIFELYHRGSQPASSHDQSFGIGLATVRRLIDMNGGEISLTSSPGNGLSVRFTIVKREANAQIPAS